MRKYFQYKSFFEKIAFFFLLSNTTATTTIAVIFQLQILHIWWWNMNAFLPLFIIWRCLWWFYIVEKKDGSALSCYVEKSWRKFMQSEGFFILCLLPEKLIYFERLKFLGFLNICLKMQIGKVLFLFPIALFVQPAAKSRQSRKPRESEKGRKRRDLMPMYLNRERKKPLQSRKLVQNYYECIIHVRQFYENVSKDFDESIKFQFFTSHPKPTRNATPKHNSFHSH